MTRFLGILFSILIFMYFALPPYLTFAGVMPLRRVISVLAFFAVLMWAAKFGNFRWTLKFSTALVLLICLFLLISALSSDVYLGVFYRTLLSVCLVVSLWFAISRIFFTSINYSQKKDYFPAVFVLVIFFVHYLVVLSEIVYGFQWTLVLPSVFDASDGWSFISEDKTRDGAIRYQGLSAHPLVFAVFCILSVSSIFYLRRIDKIGGLFFIMTLFSGAHAVYLTGSRAGILVFFFSILTNLAFFKKDSVKVSLMLLGASSFLVYSLFSNFEWLDGIFNYVSGSDSSQALNSNYVRYTQFIDAYNLFLENGLVFGFGIESAPRLMTYGTIDNLWLSILIEGGVFALFSLALLLVFAFHRSFLIKNSESRAYFLSVLFALLAFSFILSISDIFYLMIIFIGLALSSYQRFR